MTFFGNIFFLIRRPRNTERVVIFFSMLMRLHARFRTRRDVFVCVCIQRICINTSKYDNLIYTHTHILQSRGLAVFFLHNICAPDNHDIACTFLCVYILFISIYTHYIYIYNQIYIYIYIMFVLIRQMPGLSPEPQPRQAKHHQSHHHHQTLIEDLQ